MVHDIELPRPLRGRDRQKSRRVSRKSEGKGRIQQPTNDAYGHRAGDEVLRHIAATLLEFMRPGDTPARLGGDEFAVLLGDCTSVEAMQVAERIKARLQGSASAEARSIQISVSMGIAAAPGHGAAEDWLAMADRALYVAKRHGKNTASFAE